MLIDLTYFVGEIVIPGRGRSEVQENLSLAISKREPELLRTLLGSPSYELLKLNHANVGSVWHKLVVGDSFEYKSKEFHWVGLANPETKESLIANYVYYWYMRNMGSLTTVTGESKPNPEGAYNASPELKQVRAWNEMVDWIYLMYQYLNSKKEDFPDFRRPVGTYRIGYINPYGI